MQSLYKQAWKYWDWGEIISDEWMNANKHFWRRTAVTSCMCQRGRAGVGHGTLCQPTCFDDHTHTHTHIVSACSFSFWAWLRCEVTLNRKKQLLKLNYRVFCLLLFELLNLLVWLECLSLEHCSCLRIWNQCLLNNRSMMLEKSLINNMFSFLHVCMSNGCEMSHLSLITLFKYIFVLL